MFRRACMQYILTEREMNLGCELVESFESEEMNLDLLYFEQESLNQQGYFTVIHCTDVEKDLYKISAYKRK